MTFPAYPKYKDSGVEWLGPVPEGWKLNRLGSYFTERREKVSDIDFPPLSVTKSGIVPQLETAAKSDDSDNRKCVKAGDFVINGRSDRKGSSGVSDYDGSVSLINIVLAPDENFHRQFVHHLFRSIPFQDEFYRYGKGIVADLWTTKFSEMKNIVVALPSLPEQIAIAAFLDRETAKIDELVAEQQRLIELLKEKRQAVISHAVTKGLNPNAAMKDSGIPWLGQVPEHWEVIAIRHFADVLRGKFTHRPRNDPAFYDGDFPFIQTGDITGASKYIKIFRQTLNERGASVSKEFPAGTLVMAIAANIGDVAILDFPAYFPDSIVGLIPKHGVELAFIYYLMQAMKQIMLMNATISTQMNLNVDQIVSLVAAKPTKKEQLEIAEFLDERMAHFDSLMTEAETAITLLQERRAALISAAVTGKIDVRSTAQVIAFPAHRARARFLIGTAVTERLAARPTFGRVMLQKIVYLAEAHCGLDELQGNYDRQAAGPYDQAMVREIEHEMQQSGHICVEQPEGKGSQVFYKVCGTPGTYQYEIKNFLGDRAERLKSLLSILDGKTTRDVEAVATLYAVWNDALIDGNTPDDDAIVSAFLNDWHAEKKKKFRADQLYPWLGWMRRHNLVPVGKGPKTYNAQFLL